MTGGDYFDDDGSASSIENTKPSNKANQREKVTVTANNPDMETSLASRQVIRNVPINTNKLPTFEELMASEDMKKKNMFNFDDSDDI